MFYGISISLFLSRQFFKQALTNYHSFDLFIFIFLDRSFIDGNNNNNMVREGRCDLCLILCCMHVGRVVSPLIRPKQASKQSNFAHFLLRACITDVVDVPSVNWPWFTPISYTPFKIYTYVQYLYIKHLLTFYIFFNNLCCRGIKKNVN